MSTVTAFHACERQFAEKLRRKEVAVRDWSPSENDYDWLGPGIYFWEGSLRRAQEFARDRYRGLIDPVVVEARIKLGKCFDLTVTAYLNELRATYHRLAVVYQQQRLELPVNKGKLRKLDCLVIKQFLDLMENGVGSEAINFQTVRCPFEEGEPVFPGSFIRRQTHIQISVRDTSCIKLLSFHDINHG